MMATIFSARYVAPGPWAGAIIAALGGLVRKECTMMASATPATLESLRDREVIFELLRLETEVLQDLEAAQTRMMELSAATSAVCDRLDSEAIDAYFEGRKDDRDA